MDTNMSAEGSKSMQYLAHLLKIKHKFQVTRVASIDGFVQSDLPVVIAYRPNSKVLSQSGGKGVAREQAIISALMESFECHTAEEVSVDKYCREVELDGEFCDPRKLAVTMKDYCKYELNSWKIVNRLDNNLKRWIPFDAISLDFTRMTNYQSRGTFFLSSNGLASGSSWDMATTSAIYEVIERHSLTVHELQGLDSSKRIDLRSIENPSIQSVVSRLQETEQLEVHLYDNTLWPDFPTFKCLLISKSTRWAGFGCHSCPTISILRAITEANQGRVISISGSREDMNSEVYLCTSPSKDNTYSDAPPLYAPVAYDFNQKKDILTPKQLFAKIQKYHNGKWYLYQFPQIDEQVYVVRVIAEDLHGYNYPGYISSTFLESPSKALFSYNINKELHSPAAS
jgi:YcaO-like protein with predicted kinase domain